MTKKGWVLPALVAAIAVVLPLAFHAPYHLHIMILVLIWVTLGAAWNLLAGYCGQVSFGQAAFFGLGAYTAGLLAFHLEISPWWGMLLGPVVAALISIPIGLICFRLRGPYFALATLALGEIFRLLFTNWEHFTNGARGILIMPTFTAKLPYYYIALFLAAVSMYAVYRLVNSKLGFYFVSIREDQDAAASLGIPATKYKMYALLPSAFLTGLAGAFYMNYTQFIDPEVVFSLPDISIMVILVVMMGGVATMWGPAVGATVYIALNELFRTQLGAASVLAFGVLVCLVILFLPNGIVGELQTRTKRFAPKTVQPVGGDNGELLRG